MQRSAVVRRELRGLADAKESRARNLPTTLRLRDSPTTMFRFCFPTRVQQEISLMNSTPKRQRVMSYFLVNGTNAFHHLGITRYLRRSPVPMRGAHRPTRGLFPHVNRINPGDLDSLAERGGFEPPVPRGLLWAEFGRVWGTIWPDQKHPRRREFVRLEFGSASALSQTAARCSAASIEFSLVDRSKFTRTSLTASLIEKPSLAPVFNTKVISECLRGSRFGF
jgi:hypothetical protein